MDGYNTMDSYNIMNDIQWIYLDLDLRFEVCVFLLRGPMPLLNF